MVVEDSHRDGRNGILFLCKPPPGPSFGRCRRDWETSSRDSRDLGLLHPRVYATGDGLRGLVKGDQIGREPITLRMVWIEEEKALDKRGPLIIVLLSGQASIPSRGGT